MEIIKLGDDAPSELDKSQELSSATTRKITDLKLGVKNPSRVNIFLDGKFAFSLDVAQVLDAKLKLGTELDAAEVKKLERMSEFGKLYARTLEWVLARPRGVRETRDHLRLKRFQKSYAYTDDEIETVVAKLIDKKYLDDRHFAEWFIENRNVRKGTSLRRLRQELSAKGVDDSLIDELLAESSRSDEAEIKKIIARRGARSSPEQLLRYLVAHGFSYDLARPYVSEFYEHS